MLDLQAPLLCRHSNLSKLYKHTLATKHKTKLRTFSSQKRIACGEVFEEPVFQETSYHITPINVLFFQEYVHGNSPLYKSNANKKFFDLGILSIRN